MALNQGQPSRAVSTSQLYKWPESVPDKKPSGLSPRQWADLFNTQLDLELRRIPLTKGFITVVDIADYEVLAQFKWYYKDGYAARKGIPGRDDVTEITMHRQIMGFPDSHIDHHDLNRLNNRRYNLRPATVAQNMQNRPKSSTRMTSKYKGVSWDRGRKKWRAMICVLGRNQQLGRYDYEEDAALAYDVAALRHFGQFARFNFGDRVKALGPDYVVAARVRPSKTVTVSQGTLEYAQPQQPEGNNDTQEGQARQGNGNHR